MFLFAVKAELILTIVFGILKKLSISRYTSTFQWLSIFLDFLIQGNNQGSYICDLRGEGQGKLSEQETEKSEGLNFIISKKMPKF